ERLQTLESNLLDLEKNPNDKALLSALLRETHSLKGDARSAGVESVEVLTHAVEDVLSSIQIQTLNLDSAVSDRLYESLDTIGKLVDEAVTGSPANVDTSGLVQALIQIAPSSPTLPATEIDLELPTTVATPVADSLPAANKSSTQIDTIRVQVRDLDALTTQAEELAVTRIQIAQTSTQTDQIMALWEEWRTNKDKQKAAPGQSYEERFENLILNLQSTLQANSNKLELVSEDLRDRVRRLQLLPLSTLFQPLQRVVRDLAKQQSKEINLVLEGDNATADKRLLEGVKDALLHLVRNAVDHGIETSSEREAAGKSAVANLQVKAYQTAISLTIEITDDGRGLDIDKIKQTAIKRRLHSPEDLEAMSTSQIHRLILTPGFSTRSFITEISGRGVGLDVVRNQVEQLKGSIQIESTPGQRCTFRLQLSTALSTANVVLVEAQGMTFAVPIEFLKTTLLVSPKQIVTTDGQYTIMFDDQTIPVANLTDVLELSKSPIYDWVAQSGFSADDDRPCVVLNIGNEQAGFFIDRLISQQEVVSKPMGSLLKRVRNVSGTTVLGSGDICMILNPPDLLKSVQQQTLSENLTINEPAIQNKPVILLVEDSPPVRIQEKRLFEGAGYVVVTATNGLEGYNTLQSGLFDAVVSDVEMPYLDGFSLVAKIRQHQEYDNLPVILVTTLDSDADRQRGADAGANAYILKGRFNQEALLETLERLI
ncbi:MAG: response regulator, partial [Cyanobacteria bacterium P01_H01_bin.105]